MEVITLCAASGSVQRAQDPFTGTDKKRNYKTLYRLAYDFHTAHTPPMIDYEYWKNHIPGIDETPQSELAYWENTVKDMGRIVKDCHNDPFLISLLTAIYTELDNEYQILRSHQAI